MSDTLNPPKPRREKASSLRHFRRILGYVWPQKKQLGILLVAVVGMALTYSMSIGSILPVLTVMLRPEGIHGWVDDHIVESRLKVTLSAYNAQRDGPVQGGIAAGTALVVDLEPGSPLVQAGVHRGEFIVAVNGQPGSLIETNAALAVVGTDEAVKLTIRGPTDPPEQVRVVNLRAGEHSKNWAIARGALSFLPGGLTPEERLRTLWFVLAALLVIILVSNLCQLVAKYLTEVVCARSVMELRREMYAHVLNLPMSRFTQQTSDVLGKLVQDMQDIFRGLSNFFEKAVAEPLKAVGVTLVALWLQPKVTLIVLIAAPIAALLFRQFGKKIRRASKKLLAGYGQMLGVLESTLNGMRVVKGYTRENYERRRLFKIDRLMLRQQARLGLLEALASPVIEILAFLCAAGVVLWFASQVVHGKLGVEEFLTMVLCFGAIFQPVQKLSKVYPKIQRASAAGERIFEVIDSPSEYEHDRDYAALPPIRQAIEFRNVSFTYPGATKPALDNVSLTVHRGETVALVGPNGSGKTTLVSLLPRFFEPDAGQILVDGQDITRVKLRSLRKQISLITQETVIFSDTVANNILYGKPRSPRSEVVLAAERAFADEFIRHLPERYETIVGEHGATLSGGQRQRIAIARAILRDAPILIFDEATSQIDPESELKIHEALESFLRGRTAFVIAHRYSTISEADRIVVMDEGRIAAVGTHEALLESCPLYRRLYETQFREGGDNGSPPRSAAKPVIQSLQEADLDDVTDELPQR